MEQKNLQSLESLRKTLKQPNGNKQGVYPGCPEKPIRSHVIAESVLKLLADQGKVLTLERSDDDIIVNAVCGHTWERASRKRG